MSEDLISCIHALLEAGAAPQALGVPPLNEERAIAARMVRLAAAREALQAQAGRLEAERERRRLAYRQLLRGFAGVRRVGRVLLETSDVDEICRRSVRIMVEDLGAANCSILLLSADRTTLRLAAAHGLGDDALGAAEKAARFNRALTIRAGEGVAGQVVTTGKPRYLANVADDPSFQRLATAVPVKSLYCFPLRSKRSLIGVLNVSHPNLDGAGTNLRRLLSLLSGAIGQVITIARLHRRLLTEEHERQQKLASMGEMAASVAHEISNPVTNILLRAQKLKRAPRDAEEVSRLAAEMEKETHRIIKIVSKLLDVGPDEGEAPALESLNDVVEDTLVLTEHHLRAARAIAVRKDLAEDLPAVRLVRRELEQVFTNLIVNAARAMPAGGVLTIATRLATPAEAPAPGRHVAAAFADTGHGIAPEHLERIFEPFFTTARKTGGAGLGLPISREIVERYGGAIRVESTPGRGTTFTVVLPAGDA
ncbi:MAG: GAF domain-containing protein [Planctomycetes bacterium]|nr:GAF domain-containing protein [Planctomycetota bacterium]